MHRLFCQKRNTDNLLLGNDDDFNVLRLMFLTLFSFLADKKVYLSVIFWRIYSFLIDSCVIFVFVSVHVCNLPLISCVSIDFEITQIGIMKINSLNRDESNSGF